MFGLPGAVSHHWLPARHPGLYRRSVAKAYISTDLSDAVVFAVLIIVLLVRPAGLMGKYVPEKV